MADLSINAGATTTIDLTLTRTDNGQPLAAASVTTVWFVAKKSVQDADAAAPIFKYSGAGVVVTDGHATVTISPADTMPFAGTGVQLFYGGRVLLTTGEEQPIPGGLLTVRPSVVRARTAGPPQ